jgi:hypothetical protein
MYGNLGVINDVVTENNARLPAANKSDYHHGIIHSIGLGPLSTDAVGSGDAPTPVPIALAAATRVDAVYLGMVADLATLLSTFTDTGTGSTLLDQTAVILGREHGTCVPNNDPHMLKDIHNLIVGGTTAFNSGYYDDYKTATKAPSNQSGRPNLGLPYNDFLYGLMLAMGLAPEDWELDGKPGFGYTQAYAQDNLASHRIK